MSEAFKYETTDETFADFLRTIDAFAHRDEWTTATESYVAWTGEECWRDMFDEGMSPEDAWCEEVDAARTMM